MQFSSLESLIKKNPQIQLVSASPDKFLILSNLFFNFYSQVSFFSGELQKKIQQALAPFWQQRLISLENDDTPRVGDFLLKKHFFLQSDFFVEDKPFPKTDPDRLDAGLLFARLPSSILERTLLSLSNGELRRVLLARLWMENPKSILMDDLFGGLDSTFRSELSERILHLYELKIPMVIGIKREDELLPYIPAFIFDHEMWKKITSPHLMNFISLSQENSKITDYRIQELQSVKNPGETLIELNRVSVSFHQTQVIRNLSWKVRQGEHWVVMGPNGAGKSTLLSLLSADHPQIYKNDICLLGKHPGKGLNVWEHKNQIGFFSPELAAWYREKLSILEVVCTGFTPYLSLFQKPSWNEKEKAKEWLSEFGFSDQTKSFSSLSFEEKRFVLLLRAAIRPPKILLLDEPTQGMSETFRARFFELLQFLSEHTTLILVTHYEKEWPPCMTHLLSMPKFSF